MTADPVTLSSDASLDDALETLAANGFRHFPVVDSDVLMGIVSDRDVLEATGGLPRRVHAAVGRAPTSSWRVRDLVADRAVWTAAPTDDVSDALVRMIGHRIGCLAVLEGDELVGILTETDLIGRLPRLEGAGTVGEHMTRSPVTVGVDTTLEEALDVAHTFGVRHLPVLRKQRLIGLVSDRDLRRAHGLGREGSGTVEDSMTREVVSVGPQEPLDRAAELLGRSKLGALPVLEGGELVGILTTTDLLDYGLEAHRASA